MGYLKDRTIGFIGLGNMGGAILSGLISSGAVKRRNLVGFDRDPAKNKSAKRRFCISLGSCAAEVANRSAIILIAVKPQDAGVVLEEISKDAKDKIIISIAAGIKTRAIEGWLGKGSRVIRVMPNTPALVGEGISAICGGRYAGKDDLKTAEEIFSVVGETVKADERYFDVVTAVSGSGPAYFFYLKEALIEAAERLGLKKEVAVKLVSKTALGSARLLIASGDDPAVLRQRVTSKGGMTEQAIKIFEKRKIREAVLAAVRAAVSHSRKLSEG